MRHTSPSQHRLRDDEAPDSLRYAGDAEEKGRLMEVAASAKDAATMLAFCVVLQMGWSIASNASLTLWAVLTLR
jgi:hypothetical protein